MPIPGAREAQAHRNRPARAEPRKRDDGSGGLNLPELGPPQPDRRLGVAANVDPGRRG